MIVVGVECYLTLSPICVSTDSSYSWQHVYITLGYGFHMCLKCLRHVPDTIELDGASTVWDMSQALMETRL